MSSASTLPGRLGNPDMAVQDDPRTLPVLAQALKQLGIGGASIAPYPDVSDKAKFHETFEKEARAMHEAFSGLYETLPNELPEDASEVKIEPREILTDAGPDGHAVKLYVFRRADLGSAPVPAVCYIHGGGMNILNTNNKVHMRWTHSLAQLGVVSIAIDFRNSWSPDGEYRPFPTGMNDCAAAVRWISAHRSELGVSKIVLQGESGGGNLSLVTALKANREGWIGEIAGVFACVPVTATSGGWSDERKLREIPSMVENQGYLLSSASMMSGAAWYTPKDSDLTNPHAWPYFATEQDLKGLPPHVISVDELDPLRDEGIAYFRKLAAAGVQVTGQVNLGITHGSSLMFRQALPHVHNKALKEIVAFAKGL